MMKAASIIKSYSPRFGFSENPENIVKSTKRNINPVTRIPIIVDPPNSTVLLIEITILRWRLVFVKLAASLSTAESSECDSSFGL
jgi:hypothetical protein